jgi:hypothetical protein
MTQGGHSLLSAAVVILGFNTRGPAPLILAFNRGLVGWLEILRRGDVHNSRGSFAGVGKAMLQFGGDVGRYDMDRDCRPALQI